jgi:Zn-dependent peptidase ImmA (M78 family)/transcriptional regulator with XRE-family HTH domain
MKTDKYTKLTSKSNGIILVEGGGSQAMSVDIIRNIKAYRNQKGLSQSELANDTGLSESTIKKIESGVTSPRVNTLRYIALALGVRLSDLLTPVREMKSVRFRAQKKMRSREGIIVTLGKWLDDFSFLEETVGDSKPFALGKLVGSNRDDIISLAQKARALAGLEKEEPIYDICGLLEHLGVRVNTVNYASDVFFGLSVSEGDGGPAIIVNTHDSIPVERWIFSAAHELGHILLHPEAYDLTIAKEDEQEEKEADFFASHFLMPQKGFKGEWNATAGLQWVERILKVKRIFRVSYGTVLYRLIELGKTEKNAWQRFKGQYKKLYQHQVRRKKEPMGLESADFIADRFSALVRQAVEQEKITLSKAAELLRISTTEMMDRARSWKGDH